MSQLPLIPEDSHNNSENISFLRTSSHGCMQGRQGNLVSFGPFATWNKMGVLFLRTKGNGRYWLGFMSLCPPAPLCPLNILGSCWHKQPALGTATNHPKVDSREVTVVNSELKHKGKIFLPYILLLLSCLPTLPSAWPQSGARAKIQGATR